MLNTQAAGMAKQTKTKPNQKILNKNAMNIPPMPA